MYLLSCTNQTFKMSSLCCFMGQKDLRRSGCEQLISPHYNITQVWKEGGLGVKGGIKEERLGRGEMR